jgi:hypothetical protein
MSQGEILKPRKRCTRKAVELSKAVISSRNTEHPLAKCPVNHLCTSRTAGREIDRSRYADALKKTNAIRKIRNYTTRQINEHIFGTIKDNGVTITLI